LEGSEHVENQTQGKSAHAWELLLTERFVPGQVILDDEGPGGHLEQHAKLNRLWLTQLSVRPQSITHAVADLGTLSAEVRASVVAHVVVEGDGFIEQNGTCLSFGAGDISFRNLAEPSRVVFKTPGSFYAIRLPATAMRLHRADHARYRPLAPRIASGADLPAETVRRVLSGMAMNGSCGTADFYWSFALPWLFAAVYHGDSAPVPAIRAGNELRWQQALEYVEQHLYDADDLSAMTCAQAIGVSERYLHRLFAQRGLRFSRTVLAKRLEAAQAMLQCEAYREQAIASIAYQCGFKDPAHFSRLFKARYGVSPRNCRTNY
jgi:AraC-like DNA-binding protein